MEQYWLSEAISAARLKISHLGMNPGQDKSKDEINYTPFALDMCMAAALCMGRKKTRRKPFQHKMILHQSLTRTHDHVDVAYNDRRYIP